VNLLEYNIYIINKNTETLIGANKDVGLEINVEKTKNMLRSHHKNAGQNRDIKIENRSFKNVSQFKYLGTAVTNQNLIQEEIKKGLDCGNTLYPQKFALTSPISGGRSVGIVHSRTQVTELVFRLW
jgi:hypothetical protein